MVLQEIPIAEERETCRHHWIIQTAEGPVSLGVCRFCHEAKEFQNSLEEWGFDKVPIQARHRGHVREDFFEADELEE